MVCRHMKWLERTRTGQRVLGTSEKKAIRKTKSETERIRDGQTDR